MGRREIGPFSSFDLESIRSILEDHKIKYDVISSPQNAADNLKASQRQISVYPTFSGPHLNYYIELDESDLRLVQPYIEKYGVPMTDVREWAQSEEKPESQNPNLAEATLAHRKVNRLVVIVFVLALGIAVLVLTAI